MYQIINIENFLEKYSSVPVLDVRTPDEYTRGHIPGAINFPLFSNNERRIVGSIYKEKGRHPAILKGLEFAGKKLKDFVSRAREITKDNQLLIHCWRGGLRSSSIAWLLDIAGIKTYVLNGGYKTFRKYVQEYFHTSFKLLVIGGMTGSGKTEVLRHLQGNNLQVIDLETLAHHKGSAFGSLGQAKQTTNEQFENDIFRQLLHFNSAETIWIEDESQNIGSNLIPAPLFNQILQADMIYLDVPVQNRIQRLVKDYSSFDVDLLISCIQKISKRLGGLRLKRALEALKNENFDEVAGIMLQYYDKTYAYSMKKRDPSKIHPVKTSTHDLSASAEKILKYAETLNLTSY